MTTPSGCTLTSLFSLLILVISSLGVSLSSLNLLPAPSQDQRIVAENRTAANQPLEVYYETGSGLVEASRDAEGRFVVSEYGAQNGRGLYTVTVGVPPVLAQQFALSTQALYLVRCRPDGTLYRDDETPPDQGFDDMAILGAVDGDRVKFAFRYGFKVAEYPWTLAIGVRDTDPWNPQAYGFERPEGLAELVIILEGSPATSSAPQANLCPRPPRQPLRLI